MRTDSPDRLFMAGRCKRGRGSRYLYADSAQRYYDKFAEDIREIKQQRYSDNDTEESKGRCHRSSTRRYVHPDDACYDGRLMERDKERTYDRGDLDVSFRSKFRRVDNIPCKFFAEGYCKYGEDCSSSHQEPLGHSGDHKRGNSVKIRSCLSWKGPKRDDQRTTSEAPRSSRWRYDHGKESCYNTGNDNSLSRNSPPRRDGRRTIEDASKSFQCRSNDDNHDFNVDSRNILSRNSKCDEESKKEMETPNSLSPKGPNWGKQRKIIDSLNSARQRLDDGRLDCNGKSGRRFSRNGLEGDEAAAKEATNSGKCCNNVKIASTASCDGPKWGDQIASREVPNSSIWRSDDDKQDSDIKVNHGQSWNGPSGGDLTLIKAPNSSQSRSDGDICSNGVRTNHISLCNDPKWGDQSTKETSGNGPEGKERRKNELETSNSLPGNGTKWGTQRKLEGSLNFSPRRLGDDSRGYNAKSSRRFSRNDSKGSGITQSTTKDATNSGKWSNNVRINNNSSWNGPKWGDQSTKETSWNGPKWGDQMPTDTSWNGPKWGDQTPTETSWNGPKWGDETFEETPQNGPKWGDLRATKDADADKSFQESSDRRTKETSWNGPKWVNQTTKDTSRHSPAWGDKTTVEIPLGGSNWADLRTTKDADAHKSSLEISDRRTKETSWNGSNWGDQTTKESSRRSPTWGDKTTEETPKDGSKWGDLRTTKDSGAHKSSQESSYRRTKETSWNGPKWGDQTTKETSRQVPPWGDKTTSETPQNGSRWGDLRTAKDADAHKSSQESPARRTKEKTWNGLKWGDQTTMETSLHGPTWGDKTTEEAPRKGLKWSDLRTERLKGCPKWGEQVSSHSSPVSSIQRTEHDRQNHIMKHDNILPLDVSRDGDQTSAKDPPYSLRRRSAADKWGNVETDHNLSFSSQKHSGDTITKDASHTCQWRSDNDECRPCEETNNSLAQNGPKWSHQMVNRDVSNSSMWRSNDAGSGASACDSIVIEVARHEPSPLASNVHEQKSHGAFQESLFFQDQKSTQEDSGNDQHAMIISQPPSNIQDSNFCLRTQEVQDQQSIKLSEKGQTLFPSPHEDLRQGVVQSVALNGQDTIPQPTPSQQNLNSDLQNHQVLEKNKQLQHLSVTLEPLTAAATPIRSNLEYLSTELITSDSIDLNRLPISFETKEPAIMDESLTAKKNLALAPALLSGQPTNATRKENTDMEENFYQGNQEQKQDVHARLMPGGDSERLNDEQGIRMLKFALVEFVKDILKPSWRDGHLSKEAHKIIVKKVVDKVTCTLQGPAIPRSQEHIDQYMSYSKTKLTNLVMGYLGMYLKK